jgi:hypothetical protein
MRTNHASRFACAGLVLGLLVGLSSGRALAGFAEATLDYGDPVLFPGHRTDNLIELQLMPVIDGESGPIAGIHFNLHAVDGVVWVVGIGGRKSEWRNTYAHPHDFEKSYTLEMRSGWGDPTRGVGNNLVFNVGFDWSTLGGEYEDDGTDLYSLTLGLGYGLEFRPVKGLSLEFFLGINSYVFDMTESEDNGWEDVVLALVPALKISYEVITGGHPVVELRFPLVVKQPDAYDPDEGSDTGVAGGLFSMDMAFGYRQSWGPLTGGMYFIMGLVGDSNEALRDRDVFGMVFDFGFVFY